MASRKTPKTWTRDPEKEKFWRKIFAAYAVSGLSIQEFCRRHNIASGSFGAWKRELQIRDRECIASGGSMKALPLPSFPTEVKDSRGRLIPTRFRKWLELSKTAEPKEAPSPFVPLRLVGSLTATPETSATPAQQSKNQIEIVSPGGFIIRVNNQDTEFISKLLHSLEEKKC